MKWKSYPAYKDSGIEWFGEIPEHWEVWKTTHGFKGVGSGTTPKSDEPSYYDGDIPWVNTTELRETLIIDTNKKLTSRAINDYSTLKTYPVGSLLIAMYGATIGRLGILGIPAAVNQACCVFSEAKHFDVKFLYYWLMYRRPVLISLSVGGGQPNLSQEDLKSLRVPLPTIQDQYIISAFLDRETGHIDALIAKKERQIELLQEKRSALISHVVTKGLDPNAKMKDSGVDWLGEMPEHWEMRRIAMTTTKITNGYVGPTRNILVESGVKYLQSLHIKNGRILFDRGHYFVSPEWASQHDNSRLEESDVLIVQTGAETGQYAVVPKEFEGTNCHALIILRANGRILLGYYLGLVIGSHYGYHALRSIQTGALHPHLNCTFVREILIPIPPLVEQSAISERINQETRKIDLLISKVQESINKLQEYRTALISAAVTGKIDVREEAA